MHTDPPANTAECKHACKDKKTCGHLCCKRHLPVATQPKLATQRLGAASAPTSECKHTCCDKLACGHQCCKRHFSRDLAADLEKPQHRANLQTTSQTGRTPRHIPNEQDSSQSRAVSCATMLQVHGKSVPTKPEAKALSSKTKPSYHFFVYDLESTGTCVQQHDSCFECQFFNTLEL